MRIYYTSLGDTFDQIALKFYGSSQYVQALYAVNEPHLYKWRFEAGEIVYIPDLEEEGQVESLPVWRQ